MVHSGTMAHVKPRRAGAAVAAAVVLALVALRCIRGDEMLCENAVSRLQQCCAGFVVSSGYCTYSDGCGVTYPTISESDSKCVADASCEYIVDHDICNRALQARAATDASAGSDICP